MFKSILLMAALTLASAPAFQFRSLTRPGLSEFRWRLRPRGRLYVTCVYHSDTAAVQDDVRFEEL
jgi:hypothetical protein